MSTPNIRFKGFSNAWEQRKLGDCLSEITYGFTNPMSDTEDGPWKLTAKDIVNGKIDYSSARHTSQIEYESLTDKSKPLIGDLLLTKDGTLGRTAIVDTENICINQSVALLRFNEKCSAQYAKTLLDTPMYQKQMLDDAGGGTIKHIYITKVDKMFIPVPSMREQEQLVCFFDNLDNLITLHQRKCDETKILKKYMLTKMFPKNGEDRPEIRFEGFSDAWEQRKLGDIIDKFTGGASIAPDDYVEEGYRTIPKGAVNDTGVADMSGCKCVSEAFYQKNISSKTSAGELVTSLRDLVPTAPNMGRIVRIYGDSEDFLMPQGVYSIVLKKNSDEDFLIAYSNSPDYRRIITTEKNGSTQVHIRNGEFLNIDIPVPCYEEQKKIGATIRNLDNLITLHQHKCDELKEIKKYMLQNMFPSTN